MLPIKFGFIGQVVSQKIFRNQPIKNKNCLWQPCLLTKLTNMVTTDNSCFWLVDFYKKSSLKPSSQMNRNLVGSTYGRLCIKFPQNRMKGQQHRLSPHIYSYKYLPNILTTKIYRTVHFLFQQDRSSYY
jgi:hypothetical protein